MPVSRWFFQEKSYVVQNQFPKKYFQYAFLDVMYENDLTKLMHDMCSFISVMIRKHIIRFAYVRSFWCICIETVFIVMYRNYSGY